MAINVWRATVGAAVETVKETQTAIAGQTVFTLTSITYVPGSGNLFVYINGVKQIEGASNAYTETDPTTVTFTSGLDAGDEVQFVNFL